MKYVTVLAFFLISTMLLSFSNAQDIRGIKDDIGYCWTFTQMDRIFKSVCDSVTLVHGGRYIAGISPHDDYLYAARVYYPIFQRIKAKEVVIFGVTHGTVRKEIGDPQNVLILDAYSKWQGITKPIAVSSLREYIAQNLDTAYYRINNRAHELEHSIEGMLPFLQYFNPDVKIIPIMVTAMSFSRADEVSSALADVISGYMKENNLLLGDDIFFLMSADANHYGKDFNNIPFGEDSTAHRIGTNNDLRIIYGGLTAVVSEEKIDSFMQEMKNVVWCGKYSIPMGLLTTKKVVKLTGDTKIWGELLRYSDTYTEGVLPIHDLGMGITAPFSFKHWVGFCSIGYYLR
jgi:AmmeMemoRadiSam system protein B